MGVRDDNRDSRRDEGRGSCHWGRNPQCRVCAAVNSQLWLGNTQLWLGWLQWRPVPRADAWVYDPAGSWVQQPRPSHDGSPPGNKCAKRPRSSRCHTEFIKPHAGDNDRSRPAGAAVSWAAAYAAWIQRNDASSVCSTAGWTSDGTQDAARRWDAPQAPSSAPDDWWRDAPGVLYDPRDWDFDEQSGISRSWFSK